MNLIFLLASDSFVQRYSFLILLLLLSQRHQKHKIGGNHYLLRLNVKTICLTLRNNLVCMNNKQLQFVTHACSTVSADVAR